VTAIPTSVHTGRAAQRLIAWFVGNLRWIVGGLVNSTHFLIPVGCWLAVPMVTGLFVKL
jgi:hypothetical protein